MSRLLYKYHKTSRSSLSFPLADLLPLFIISKTINIESCSQYAAHGTLKVGETKNELVIDKIWKALFDEFDQRINLMNLSRQLVLNINNHFWNLTLQI